MATMNTDEIDNERHAVIESSVQKLVKKTWEMTTLTRSPEESIRCVV